MAKPMAKPMAASRRTVLCALAAAPLALAGAGPAMAAHGAGKSFTITRGGAVIGTETISARHQGEDLIVRIEIDAAVTFLGLAAYRYGLDSREVWRGGRLVSLDATADVDGEPGFARVRRGPEALIVEGSAYAGPAPLDAVTTSHWSRAFIDRSTWINAQTGEVVAVSARPLGEEIVETGAGPVSARRWRISGGVEAELWYDAAGDWIASAFDGRGKTVRLSLDAGAQSLQALWNGEDRADGAGVRATP